MPSDKMINDILSTISTPDSLVGLAAAATSIASVMAHAHSSAELATLDVLHKVLNG